MNEQPVHQRAHPVQQDFAFQFTCGCRQGYFAVSLNSLARWTVDHPGNYLAVQCSLCKRVYAYRMDVQLDGRCYFDIEDHIAVLLPLPFGAYYTDWRVLPAELAELTV